MPTWSVHNMKPYGYPAPHGLYLGSFVAPTEEGALDAWARSRGFPSLAEHPQAGVLRPVLRVEMTDAADPAPADPPTEEDLAAYEEAYDPTLPVVGGGPPRFAGACLAVQDLVAEVRRLRALITAG
jgi:hypothetical protein